MTHNRRTRQSGGGRKCKLATLGGLTQRIERLVPSESGAVLQWTTRSLRELAGDIQADGYDASRNIVSGELRRMGFQLTRNRELPAGRDERDVDAQFKLVDGEASSQMKSNRPVIFLTGCKVKNLNCPVRLETSFMPPYEIAQIDTNFKEIPVRLPDGTYCSCSKERTVEEKKAIKRQKREAIRLDLDILTTERDGGLFTAAVLAHWWRNAREALFPHSDSLLLVTHGGSPDCISSGTWEWSMDRLAKKLGITITVGRLPPATWRFLVPRQKLFFFTWLRFEKKKIEKRFAVEGSLLGNTPCRCEEIKEIPLIGRDFPKQRCGISQRVRETFCIHRLPPYGDWNYSFGRRLRPLRFAEVKKLVETLEMGRKRHANLESYRGDEQDVWRTWRLRFSLRNGTGRVMRKSIVIDDAFVAGWVREYLEQARKERPMYRLELREKEHRKRLDEGATRRLAARLASIIQISDVVAGK